MQHKWHKEIKAWADGKTIQARWNDKMSHVKRDWHDCNGLIDWNLPASDFRIKPQPKESQYLYVWIPYDEDNEVMFDTRKPEGITDDGMYKLAGKIKLEEA